MNIQSPLLQRTSSEERVVCNQHHYLCMDSPTDCENFVMSLYMAPGDLYEVEKLKVWC